MRTTRVFSFTLLLLLLITPLALAEDLWLHVRVQDGSESGETVRINLPYNLLETVLPMIRDEHFQGGTIRLDQTDLDKVDIKALIQAVTDSPDGEYVTVDGDDEKVQVVKRGEFLLVHVVDDDETKVEVKLPMSVAQALVDSEATKDGELNLLAAIRELGKFRGDLVTVHDGDNFVRIWIDNDSQAE